MPIDGKKTNEQIGESLLQTITPNNLKPSLGILCVGDDPASLAFINVKKKFGEKWGFSVNILQIPEPGLQDVTDLEDFKNKIILSLKDLQSKNDSVIVQLPLPEKVKKYTDEILSYIEKEKDVDNLSNGSFVAPIVLALKKVLDVVENIDYTNTKFGIVGLGQVVGLPIKKYLDENGFDVQIVGKGEYEKLKDCDVVISGVGIPFLIKKDFIKQGAVLIDYGCSFVNGKACGDFDEECFSKASYYTPVPGCMGPLVVASLFENVLKTIPRGK